jgi:hypothetical protein
MRRIPADAGSLIIWRVGAIHANGGQGNRVQDLEPDRLAAITVTKGEAIADPARVRQIVEAHSVLVVTGVMGVDAHTAGLEGLIQGIERAQVVPGAFPLGFRWSQLVKCYGLAGLESVQRVRCDPGVIDVFAALYGTRDLTVSVDAVTFAADTTQPTYDPRQVRRAGVMVTFCPADVQTPGIGSLKAIRLKTGHSCTHCPHLAKSDGGVGHMSNRGQWSGIVNEPLLPELAALLGP